MGIYQRGITNHPFRGFKPLHAPRYWDGLRLRKEHDSDLTTQPPKRFYVIHLSFFLAWLGWEQLPKAGTASGGGATCTSAASAAGAAYAYASAAAAAGGTGTGAGAQGEMGENGVCYPP